MFSDYGPGDDFPPVFFSAKDRTLSRLCSYLGHKNSPHNSMYLMRSTHFLGLEVMDTEMNGRTLFSIPVAYSVVGRKQGPERLSCTGARTPECSLLYSGS